MNMLPQHWLLILIMLAIGYAIGARKPALVPYLGVA